jgi:hypothetical protein
MKWYFATNEGGCHGDNGFHAKLAVLSALRNTRLEPHLITTGFRNEFTAWMEHHGVKLIDATLPLMGAIRRAAAKGTYSEDYVGHWLRCEIPLLEQDDEFVLYTDVDVLFLKGLDLRGVRPPVFAAAPEFRRESRNYVNTGVMVMNVPALRETAPAFMSYVADEIAEVRGSYHDQHAYNRFYRGEWTPLDPVYNWKPYWPRPADASILHFHGAKLGAIRVALDRKADYSDEWWRTVGSLLAAFPRSYREAVSVVLPAVQGWRGDLPDRAMLESIVRDLGSAPPVPPEVIDLSFLDFAMFGD